jgi:hypothetical protein
LDRIKKFAVLLSLLTLFIPTSARASSILIGESQSWSYDGSADGCSACQATVLFELISGTSLKISFENTSTDWLAGANILTGIGFDTDGNLQDDLSIVSQSIEGGKSWKLSGGIGGGNWEVALASKNGITNGLDNQSDLSDSGWLIVGWTSPVSGLYIGSSTAKFQGVTSEADGIHAAGAPSSLAGQSSELVSMPEPAGLLLFAAGGVATLRRCRHRFHRTRG